MAAIEIKVPVFAESVKEGTILAWNFQVGDFVREDDILVEVETDKVVFEVPAPFDGYVRELLVSENDTIYSEQAILKLEEGKAPAGNDAPADKVAQEVKPANAVTSSAAQNLQQDSKDKSGNTTQEEKNIKDDAKTSPAVRRNMEEKGISKSQVNATGGNNRILMQDLEGASILASKLGLTLSEDKDGRVVKRVPMSRIRTKIAERLLSASQETAMLTTFNEVDMKFVMEARLKYKDVFLEEHGVKLGFMSFFVKAAVEALKRFPAVNAYLDGNEIIYHSFFDLGIAVSTDRGLMVPILRDAQELSLSQIEAAIVDFGTRARSGKIEIDEMQGGTFSITNGGTFGSMLSTPILNPPQSAILGMHNIVKRAVVINDEIVIRPMMYLALSYDHRIIDGKEAVSFLRTIKEYIEDPYKMLFDL